MSWRRQIRSKFERRLADSLETRGIPYGYETLQLEYYTKVRGGVCDECGGSKEIYQRHWYTPDFILSNNGIQQADREDRVLIIEAKGYFTSKDRNKMKAVKEAHPDEDIRMVFMGNNKIHKNSDTRYGDWCDKHGFPWAIKEIPSDWFNRT